jgi:transcriptional regulator with XRE-family HTH domain
MELRLRHWREKRGYSVRQLAERAGVSYVSIVKIENGRMSPTVAMLEKLAKALDISVREFFPVVKRSSEPRTRR